MSSEIKNNPDETRRIANLIGDLDLTDIPKANGTNKDSDGLTARYSDAILNCLDENLKSSFQMLMSNSKQKFNWIADDFERADKNASMWGNYKWQRHIVLKI